MKRPTKDLDTRVSAALDGAPPDKAASARKALDGYLAVPDPAGATILLAAMTDAVGDQAAYVALDMKPPRPGLVYCCATMGWVTPAKRDAHAYDYSFGWD